MKPSSNDGAPPPITISTTTKTTRSEPVGIRGTMPDFWDYIASLKESDWQNAQVIIYVYRDDPPDGPVEKVYNPYLTMPSGQLLSFNDKESFESAFAEKWGGKKYHMMLKSKGQLLTKATMVLNAFPAKYPDMPQIAPPSGSPGMRILPANQQSDTAQVANAAINAMSPQSMVDSSVRALEGAASVIQRLAAGTNNSSNDEMTRQFMQVAIARMVEDPTERMMKFFAMMKEFSGPQGKYDEIVGKVMTTGLERILSPAAPVAPAEGSSLMGGLVTSAVNLLPSIMSEWRRGQEAQAEVARAAMQAGVGMPQPQVLPAELPPQPNPMPPPRPIGIVQPIQQPNPMPAGAQPMPTPGAPPLEYIEAKLVEWFNSPEPIDEVADRFVEFLTMVHPQLLEQLVKAGKDQLLTQLWPMRPILKQGIPQGPRLNDFLDSFLKYGNDFLNPGPAPQTSGDEPPQSA